MKEIYDYRQAQIMVVTSKNCKKIIDPRNLVVEPFFDTGVSSTEEKVYVQGAARIEPLGDDYNQSFDKTKRITIKPEKLYKSKRWFGDDEAKVVSYDTVEESIKQVKNSLEGAVDEHWKNVASKDAEKQYKKTKQEKKDSEVE